MRFNTNKLVKTGKYNTFFKIVDLCGPKFKKNISVSPDFTITISRGLLNEGPMDKLGIFKRKIDIEFNFKGQKEAVRFEKNECIFYGNLEEINFFCITLLLKVLAKIKNKEFLKNIYFYLESVSKDNIEQLIIAFAKNITLLSEFNIRGILQLTPHMIDNIHDVTNNVTYCLNNLSQDEYKKSLTNLANKSKKFPFAKKEQVLQILTQNKDGKVTLYNETLYYNYRLRHSYYNFEKTSLDFKNDFSKKYLKHI